MPAPCSSIAAAVPGTFVRATVRVVVVDRHWFVRRGLCALIGIEREFEVCGEMEPQSWDDAALARWAPDVVVLDVCDAEGESRVRELRRRVPAPGVVALSLHEEPGQAERLRAAGASVFLLKSAAPDRIHAAVRQAAADAAGAGAVVAPAGASELDATDDEILAMIGYGLPLDTIAIRLRLPVGIVENRLSRLRRVLKLRSGVELVEYSVAINRRSRNG